MARQYSASFKHDIIEAYFSSKLTLKSFASNTDVPYDTLRGWIGKDSRYKDHKPNINGSFVPIKLSDPKEIHRKPLVILYPNGVKIELASSTDLSFISSLIRAY